MSSSRCGGVGAFAHAASLKFFGDSAILGELQELKRRIAENNAASNVSFLDLNRFPVLVSSSLE